MNSIPAERRGEDGGEDREETLRPGAGSHRSKSELLVDLAGRAGMVGAAFRGEDERKGRAGEEGELIVSPIDRGPCAAGRRP